jgi:hypothetical protein
MKVQCVFAQTGEVRDGCSATQGDHKVVICTGTRSSGHHPLFHVYTHDIGVQHMKTSTPLEGAHRNHHIAWISPAVSHDPEEWSKEEVVVAVRKENARTGFPSQLPVELKRSVEPPEARSND